MDEKREVVQAAVEKFGKLDASTKSFVLGYLLGKQEAAEKHPGENEKKPA